VKRYRRKGRDTGILAREKKHKERKEKREGNQAVLRETGFERLGSYLLPPSPFTRGFHRG